MVLFMSRGCFNEYAQPWVAVQAILRLCGRIASYYGSAATLYENLPSQALGERQRGKMDLSKPTLLLL